LGNAKWHKMVGMTLKQGEHWTLITTKNESITLHNFRKKVSEIANIHLIVSSRGGAHAYIFIV